MEDFTITHIGDTALSLPMPFKFIPAKGKTFMFQADDASNLVSKTEGIPIAFEKDFWMCIYQTTQEFWELARNEGAQSNLIENRSSFKGKFRPIENVSWDDTKSFIKHLNSLNNLGNNIIKLKSGERLSGKFNLPSETQWEYAADADQNLVFSGSQNLHDVGWFTENSNNQTMPVGLKQPNAWGLYDMSGNLLEWCADDFKAYNPAIPKNGEPYLNKSNLKALRGGAFFDLIKDSRITYRFSGTSEIQGNSGGFRLVFSSELQL